MFEESDVAQIEASGAAVPRLVHDGDLHKVIIAAAKEIGSGLIIMGYRSQCDTWDVLLGSNVENVVRYASYPVPL